MRIIERIKNWFKRGGYALTGQELQTINDHPKINIDPLELQRIRRNFIDYQGNYQQVEYRNSMGQLKKRNYFYLNMSKLTAEYLAGLVFNEQCEINISDAEDDNESNSYQNAHDFIQHVLEHNDFKKNFADYLEPMFAVGGITVRPYVDMNTGEIEYAWALADAFFPLKSNSNGISEGVIVSTSMEVDGKKTIYYTLLEFHEWGTIINEKGEEEQVYIITNELYKSDDPNVIGKRVPLSEKYHDLQEETIFTGLSRPIFNYLKPKGFNNLSPHSPLGLSITDNCKPTLRKINDTFDQYWWEVKMGQRTVFVDDSMLQTLPSEDGMPPKQIFDPDINVYKSMRFSEGKDPVKDVTNDIRAEQYIQTINQSLRTLEMQLKFSPGTFSFDGRSVKTATEIVSENSQTYRTRNEQINAIEKFIKGLIISTLELAKATEYNGKKLYDGEIPSFEHIGVDFDDGIFVDKMQQLRFLGQAKTFGFIPTVEAIQRLFNVPKEVAEEWAKEIREDEIGIDPMQIQQQREEVIYGDEE